MKKTGIINKIIAFSNVDGPGNRTAVFFQGCNVSCLFCHNPETIRHCVGCGKCVDLCPAGALELHSPSPLGQGDRRPWAVEEEVETDGSEMVCEGGMNPPSWFPSRCVSCDNCIKACPHLASPRVRSMTARELAAEIKKTAPYINGVSFSGGECTLQRDFLAEVIPLIRELGLGVLLDSNGTYDFEKDRELLGLIQGVMLDIKAANPDFCRTLTGAGPELPLKNLEYLQSQGKLAEVRTVLFPRHPEENETTVRTVAARLSPSIPYKLLRYRPFGVRREGLDFLGSEITSQEEAAVLAALARSLGAEKCLVV